MSIGSAFRREPSAATPVMSWLPTVLILTAVYALNFIDRQVINILVEPIKNDLRLSDVQIGAVTGLSFALVYGFTVLPIARLAERVDRPLLISCAMTVWSGATALCGVTQSFAQLAAARVAVGLGEAGYAPASYSLMTETVPARRRTVAFGIFSAGPQLGLLIAFSSGGLIAAAWGWRAAFLVVGLPGIAMAVAAALLLPEPRRALRGTARPRQANFRQDLSELMRKRSFRLFVLAGGLTSMTGFGVPAFITSFFLRNHAAELDSWGAGSETGGLAVLGPILGLILGFSGIVSALASGTLTDRLVARNIRHYGTVAGVPQLLAVVPLAAALYSPSLAGALACLALHLLLANTVGPPQAAGLQALASSTNRATASGISIVTMVIMGNGLGPFLIGAVSDLLAASGYASGDALRIALLVGAIPALLGSVIFIYARRYLAVEAVSAAN